MIRDTLQTIQNVTLSPLDLIPQNDLREKLVDLVLCGVPSHIHSTARSSLSDLRTALLEKNVENTKVVVFGGGSGLSNIVGGDSRHESWATNPFNGLKEIFPRTQSIVCVTDNGGSTGELLKDLPLIAIGDIRHVLLSSIRRSHLQKKYMVTAIEAVHVASLLSDIFNLRSREPLRKGSVVYLNLEKSIKRLPLGLERYLTFLLEYLFNDRRLAETLSRTHCLGNLLLVAAIYREIDEIVNNNDMVLQPDILHFAMLKGLNALAKVLGANERAVLPCTSTPAQLRVLYTNGVEIIGEHKLGTSRRGYPVDSVHVDYFHKVNVFDEIIEDITSADILILAPGSLYSSIIPVFKVPGIADAVRENKNALKVLVSNLWVQAGETDITIADPERKFHVSDMIKAYEKNIPGGTQGLFREVLCVSLKDIPGSILQRYAVENKIPIFLDKDVLLQQNYIPIECGIYSRDALEKRGVIQHDPQTLALAIKTLFNAQYCFGNDTERLAEDDSCKVTDPYTTIKLTIPFERYRQTVERIGNLKIDWIGTEEIKSNIKKLNEDIVDILWDHPIIPLSHLQFFDGIQIIEKKFWRRDQRWDNVFSFFDPNDKCIKIRGDQISEKSTLEVAFLIALGESLLGDYAKKKMMTDVVVDHICLGKAYHLYLKDEKTRTSFLNTEQLRTFLLLARMCPTDDYNHFTRLVNLGEGFTPPGLLIGLVYAWYIDNRLASNIEYKMSVTKISHTNLIPEQMKMVERRSKMISFFKNIIFGGTQ